MGPVNYKVHHLTTERYGYISGPSSVNLLKPCKDREVVLVVGKQIEGENRNPADKVHIGPNLNGTQSKEVIGLVNRNQDLFTSHQGKLI